MTSQHYHNQWVCLYLSSKCVYKQVLHIHILLPHITDRLVRKGCGVHIRRWTKLGRDIQAFFAVLLMLIDDLLPQSQMARHSVLPFRGAGIRDLWSFGIAHARMDIICPGDGKLDVLALVSKV